MKKLLLFTAFFILAQWSVAQVADTLASKLDTSIVKITTNKKGGFKTIQLRDDHLVLKNDSGIAAVHLFLYKSNQAAQSKTVILEFQDVSGKISCVAEQDRISVNFSDSTKTTIYQSGYYNCKGTAVRYYRGTWGWDSQLNELKVKNILSVRVWGGASYVDANFTEEQFKLFRKALNIIDGYSF